jgi:hypothetical protein
VWFLLTHPIIMPTEKIPYGKANKTKNALHPSIFKGFFG